MQPGQADPGQGRGARVGPVEPVLAPPRAGIRAERTPARYPGAGPQTEPATSHSALALGRAGM